MDTLMEQVAMYMAALPCPPMPLVVDQEEEDRKYTNSHDLIAYLLLLAMSQRNQRLNEERKVKQKELTEKLLGQLQGKDLQWQEAYCAFSEFTAGYICAFANINVLVSFMPADYVQRHDCVHKACCSWHKAQEIILHKGAGSDENSSMQERLMHMDFSHLSYGQLLQLHCKRFRQDED